MSKKLKKNADENPEYRLYSLTNRYLSGIQKGIQTAHVVGELVQLPDISKVVEWARDHATIIVLDGGNCDHLVEFCEILEKSDHPWARFNEDSSLGFALTAVGVILPKKVYSGKSKNKTDKALYSYIKDLPLAV